MNKILQILFFIFISSLIGFSQNPKIKISYKVQRGMMRTFEVATSSIVNAGGPCTETGAIEVRVHARFKSTSAPANGSSASYNAMGITPCPTGGNCNACATGSAGGWSCEQRCETATNAGSCGNWVNNSSQNASYPGDPGYVISSNYPSNETLEVQMKGFESDNFNTIVNSDKVNFNYQDGACQTTCTNGSCYGNYQIPTSGRYNTVDIGTVTNTTPPFCGSNWSSSYDAAYQGTACALDLTGYYAYYYLQWQYRWCWDATTLFDSHAGLIKFPLITEICSGSNLSIVDSTEAFEAARGYASYQWQYTTDGTNWNNIIGATSKNLSTTSLTNVTTNPITYTIRRAALYCIDFANSPGYKYVYTNNQVIIVYPQPIAPTLYAAGTNPPSGTTICKGLFTYAQFDAGTGGYIDAVDEYEYSINNGANWVTYIPGNSINTANAITNVLVRVRRTAGNLSSCTTTPWTTLVTWPLSTAATPPTLSSSTPANKVSICLPSTDISGVINQGSGGTGYEYGYSITNANIPSTIITGTIPSSSFIINTTGATTKINLFGRQTGVGVGACNPTPWALIAEWPIVTQPTGPTLLTKTPNQSTILIGENVSISTNAGTNGASDATDEYRISFDDGVNWSSYTVNTDVQVPIGSTKVIIQGKRNTGNTFACSSTVWNELASWVVDVVLPIQLVSFSGQLDNEKQITLNWVTLSELNSKAFLIQKSKNAIDWLELGLVHIFENSTTTKYYSFIDTTQIFQNNFFRLKIVDIDNSVSYSNIINVRKQNYAPTKFNIFPNPVQDVLNINTNTYNLNYSIDVFDMYGNIIFKSNVFNSNDGNISINVRHYMKGVYSLRINSDDNISIYKFVKN